MTNVDASTFGRARSAFALSAAITILLNTVVACTKDAYSPLKLFMASLTGQDLTSQGLADVVVFVGLGLILLEASFAEKINPTPVISFLVGAVTVAVRIVRLVRFLLTTTEGGTSFSPRSYGVPLVL